ncbi:MAG: hypothetical protein ACFFA0_01030 [Promethearchaeota archaeon]
MKEIVDILTVFFNIMRDDILTYYQKTYSYIKDLIRHKKIDLNKPINSESEFDVKKNLDEMLKAIRTGLNTIGIPLDDLDKIHYEFLDFLNKENLKIINYNSYFEIYLNGYVNKLLLGILIEYLINVDFKKLENANLFDLLPPYFLSKLNEFKKSHFNSPTINEMFKPEEYSKFINFTDLKIIEPVNQLELDILTQLRNAKEGSLETLKTSKVDVIAKPINHLNTESKVEITLPSPQIEHIKLKSEYDLQISLNTRSFIDFYGNFKPIHPDIIREFKIDKLNLINSKVVNRDYFDLENLFYYISIIKMLNLESPFSNDEIIDILKNYVKTWVFTSSIDDIPDIINNFYGLAIFTELEIKNSINLFDIQEIENLIFYEITNLVPEELQLNLYCILCLKLISKLQQKRINRKLNLEPIINLDLFSLHGYKPTIDIFNYISILKLLGKENKIETLKEPYLNEIKKLITLNGSIEDLITESARALLILSLLNVKEKESVLCSNILNFIINKTSFFFTENIHRNFNWRSDKLSFKIELEMLYWSLLASSQFSPNS